MKNKEKKYKKVRRITTLLNRNNQNKNNSNINNDNIRENMDYEEDPESFIKSKSINKIKSKNGFNLKKNKTLKLPLLSKSVNMNNNNIESNESKFTKKLNVKKINISTNDINNHNTSNKKSIKLTKHSGSSYKLKVNQNSIKKKNLNANSSANFGVVRHLDRKIIKEKKIMMPNKGYKLFTTTKIINNFNNQINQNKNKEIYTMGNNINTNDDNNNDKETEIDVLYDFEKKIAKIQNCFRKHLKDEDIHLNTEKVNNEIEKNNVIDIISDISLSDKELNISKEDSFDNINTSLDNEEIK
jgi:hypothetical protein